jgi:hypothetical protein
MDDHDDTHPYEANDRTARRAQIEAEIAQYAAELETLAAEKGLNYAIAALFQWHKHH